MRSAGASHFLFFSSTSSRPRRLVERDGHVKRVDARLGEVRRTWQPAQRPSAASNAFKRSERASAAWRTTQSDSLPVEPLCAPPPLSTRKRRSARRGRISHLRPRKELLSTDSSGVAEHPTASLSHSSAPSLCPSLSLRLSPSVFPTHSGLISSAK